MKKFLSKTKLHYFIIAAVLLAVFVMPAEAQIDPPYVPSGSISPDVWDPPPDGVNLWVNGNAKGYAEGETAAMSAKITGENGNTYKIDFCLQVYEDPFKDSYGFVGFEDWDTSFMPPYLPGMATPVDYYDGNWDKDELVWGYNAEVNYVTTPSLGSHLCDTNYLGVQVGFTVNDPNAYLLFGGRLAKPGDATPAGSPTPMVQGGQGAHYMTGGFKVRLAGAGSNTINFQGNQIALAPQLELTKTVTYVNGTCPGSVSLEIPKGEDVKYCFDVYNGGTAPLTDPLLTDPLLGGNILLYDAWVGGNLVTTSIPAGGHAYASVDYTDVQVDTLNTATASGSSLTYDSSSQVWVYVIDIEVTKEVSKDGTTWEDHVNVTAGDDIWWKIVITNNSTREKPVTLAVEDKLNDVVYPLTGCPTIPETLVAGASYTCMLGPIDAVVGTHNNYVKANGCYLDANFGPQCDMDDDTASYKATATIKVCKTDTEDDAIAGWGMTLSATGMTPDSKVTGTDGCYTWTVDKAATYTVTEDTPMGWTPQGPTTENFIVAGAVPSYGPHTFVNFQNMDVQVCKEDTEGDPIEGWKVYINDVEKLTGTDGCATFPITAAGKYTVTEEKRDGWTAVSPISYEFNAVSGGSYGPYTFVNFKNMDVQVCKTTTEGAPVAGWKVYLNGVEKTTAEITGCVTYTITAPGSYTVTEENRAGWTATPPISYQFTAVSGGSYGPYTFVNFRNTDVVVCKTNTEGAPIKDWKVYINDVEKLTGTDGCATFTITTPGLKTVTEEARTGWTAITPISYTFTAASGGSYGPYTFVNFQNVMITACKYKTLSPTEVLSPTPLSSWPVYLYKDAVLFDSQTTGADGCYTWTITAPGAYQVREGSYPYWTPVGPTVSAIWPVTSGRGPFSVDFYNYREPGCVLTQGYWKNHADPYKQDGKFYDDAWDYVGGPDALFFGTGQTWIQVLNTPPAGGNAYYILAYQYIAAVLNGYNGADTSYVAQELADAFALLDFYASGRLIPADGTEFSMNDRAMAIELAYILDEFNNGYGGVPHCDF